MLRIGCREAAIADIEHEIDESLVERSEERF